MIMKINDSRNVFTNGKRLSQDTIDFILYSGNDSWVGFYVNELDAQQIQRLLTTNPELMELFI